MPATHQGRSAAVEKARAILAQRPLYLDTETTGLKETGEVVEVCILDSDGTALLDTLVRPSRLIPPDATAIHGITNELVQQAPAWPEVWPQVRGLLRDRTVAIYNAEFDRRILEQTCRRYMLRPDFAGAEFFCVMLAYAEFRGEWNERRGGYRWQTLEQAGRQFGLMPPNAHRARADTLLAREVLQAMARAE